MRFTVNSSLLRHMLYEAIKVIPTKTIVPAFGYFLIEIDDEHLMHITASDGDIYYYTWLPCIESTGEMKMCVSSKLFYSSVSSLGEQPIVFECEDGRLVGTHTTGSFTMTAFPAGDYPDKDWDNEAGEQMFEATLDGEILSEGLRRCMFTLLKEDDIRRYMSAVNIDFTKDDVTFVGTNGKTLVRNRVRERTGVEGSVLVPNKVAQRLMDMCDPVHITVYSFCALIKNEGFAIRFIKPEHRYPNYNAVIPTAFNLEAVVPRQDLIEALRRIGVVCSKSVGIVKLSFTKNTLTLTGQDIDFGTSGKEVIKVECSTDKTVNIGKNYRLLLDALMSMISDTVTMHIVDAARPSIIVPSDSTEDDDWLVLVMPMMLSE